MAEAVRPCCFAGGSSTPMGVSRRAAGRSGVGGSAKVLVEQKMIAHSMRQCRARSAILRRESRWVEWSIVVFLFETHRELLLGSVRLPLVSVFRIVGLDAIA